MHFISGTENRHNCRYWYLIQTPAKIKCVVLGSISLSSNLIGEIHLQSLEDEINPALIIENDQKYEDHLIFKKTELLSNMLYGRIRIQINIFHCIVLREEAALNGFLGQQICHPSIFFCKDTKKEKSLEHNSHL